MKLFRINRFRLMEKGKIKKYMAYAIGEIILVIIGILIALGINNWRQNQLISQANIELQDKVLEQLDKDIESLEIFQKELDVLQETYLKALGREYDKSKMKRNGLISTILFDVTILSLDQRLINLIDNADLDNSKTSQSLLDLRSVYKLYAIDIGNIENVIYQKLVSNLEILEKSQSWYPDLITDFKCENDCIDFLLHDEGQKSRIASIRFLYITGYGGIIDGFYNDIVIAKNELQELVKTR